MKPDPVPDRVPERVSDRVQSQRSASPLLIAGGLIGLAGVACGAFGAHALADRLSPQALETWRTGALYHLVHAPVIVAIALSAQRLRLQSAGWLFILGILLFSGSLYLLALGAGSLFGPVTPLGGLCFMAAWLLLSFKGWRATGSDADG